MLVGMFSFRLPSLPRPRGRRSTRSQQVAQTILAQLGGAGRLSAMIGARDFVAYSSASESPHGQGLGGVAFKFPNRARSKPNYLKIILDPSDTYTVEFGRTRGYDYRVLRSRSGVYVSQLRPLIEAETGLQLSLGTMGRAPTPHDQIIRTIWQSAHPDFRSEPGSQYHPGVMAMGPGGSTIYELRKASDAELQRLWQLFVRKPWPGQPSGRRGPQLGLFVQPAGLDCAGSDYAKRPCAEQRLEQALSRWRAAYPPAVIGALRARVDNSQGWGWTVEAAVPASVLGPGPFEVLTASATNPDLMHGQGPGTGYWPGSQPLKPTWHAARTVAEAAMIARQYIDRSGIGGGNWTGGQIRPQGSDKPIARVAYNGSVYLLGDFPTPEVIVDGPKGARVEYSGEVKLRPAGPWTAGGSTLFYVTIIAAGYPQRRRELARFNINTDRWPTTQETVARELVPQAVAQRGGRLRPGQRVYLNAASNSVHDSTTWVVGKDLRLRQQPRS